MAPACVGVRGVGVGARRQPRRGTALGALHRLGSVLPRDLHAEVLSPRDVAALKLAGELHLARLEEIPRELAEAQQRREAHDAARRTWLDEQKAFESDAPPAR